MNPCSFPLATVVVLFAARYKAVESEAAFYASGLDARFGDHGTDDPLVEPLIYERSVSKGNSRMPQLNCTFSSAAKRTTCNSRIVPPKFASCRMRRMLSTSVDEFNLIPGRKTHNGAQRDVPENSQARETATHQLSTKVKEV
jgi:hypothetical protein